MRLRLDEKKFFAVVGWRSQFLCLAFRFISFYSHNHTLSLENLPISAVAMRDRFKCEVRITSSIDH